MDHRALSIQMYWRVQFLDRRPTPRLRAAAAIAAAGVGDGALVALVSLGDMPVAIAMMLHVGLLALTLGWLRRLDGHDWAQTAIGLVAVAVAGPLGAACMIALTIMEQLQASPNALLDDWHRRMSSKQEPDAASRLHEAILADRVRPLGVRQRRSFRELLASGTLAEKQAVLGVIGLRYHKDYFALLALALRSPEASIRAQAAAVFVNLKDCHTKQLKSVLAGGDQDVLKRIQVILDCTESGFVDAVEAQAAIEVAKSLCEAAMAGSATVPSSPTGQLFCRVLAASEQHERLVGLLIPVAPTLTVNLRTLLGQSLMALGRYRELAYLTASWGTEGRRPNTNVAIASHLGGGP